MYLDARTRAHTNTETRAESHIHRDTHARAHLDPAAGDEDCAGPAANEHTAEGQADEELQLRGDEERRVGTCRQYALPLLHASERTRKRSHEQTQCTNCIHAVHTAGEEQDVNTWLERVHVPLARQRPPVHRRQRG